MFISIGPVRASKIIRDRASGYSYGFGFVDYMSEEDAEKAIKELNGLQVQHKNIKVAYSRNHEDAKQANLYIRNLPREMTQDQLKDLFSACGDVVQCRILTDQFTGLSKGVGFVLYDKKQEADRAINTFNNTTPPGGTEALNVKRAEDNTGKARPPAMGGGGGGGPMGDYGYAPPPAGGGGRGRGGYGMNGGGPMRGMMGRGYRYNPMGGGGSGVARMMAGNTPYGGPPAGGGHTLFVYNIGLDADENSVYELFGPFGTIDKVDIMRDVNRGNQCKGFCFVTFRNLHEAANACNALNGYTYKTKPLQVSFKKQ